MVKVILSCAVQTTAEATAARHRDKATWWSREMIQRSGLSWLALSGATVTLMMLR